MNSEAVVQPRSNGSKRIRVLMADPDESLHPVYRVPLLQEGFEVAAASSGLECVARLRERAPDILVLEPQLPWGGGEGVLAMMGEVPQLAAVPVVDQVDSGIHTAIPHARVTRNRSPPLAGIPADEVVGLARKFFKPGHVRIWISAHQSRAHHNPPSVS